MAYPKRREIRHALLRVLLDADREMGTSEVYARVTEYFPNLTEEENNQRFGIGERRWPNIIRGVKAIMLNDGLVTSPRRGHWKLTEKGKREISD